VHITTITLRLHASLACLADEERAALERESDERLYAWWTCKEALFKASDCGLSVDPVSEGALHKDQVIAVKRRAAQRRGAAARSAFAHKAKFEEAGAEDANCRSFASPNFACG
jgi:phosphopantetheinyl transferase